MELKWLEDFLSLADTLNFSRTAEARSVTQPALSRRIRSLEEWLGVDLINRSSYPISLTPAGTMFRDFAKDLVAKTYSTRTLMRGETASDGLIHISAPHALILNFLSDWIFGVAAEYGPLVPRLTATNTYEGLRSLVEGHTCDFAVVYHHPQVPIVLPENRYPFLTLRRDTVVPVISAHSQGSAGMKLPGSKVCPIPFVAYPQSLFMGQIVELILPRAPKPAHLLRCFETDLLEAAKAMVMAGRGIAWLPKAIVSKELAEGKLALAGSEQWSEPIDIRIYYSVDNQRALPKRIWDFISRKLGPNAEPTD
ncbi:MAG: LysR family transcriptional regulator [Burkholderiales bacterium]|nr:LysR family transcriptional regulator [Burkholderiales bacterium]